MPYPEFEQDKEYLFSKFRNPVFDPATGKDNDTICDEIVSFAGTLEGMSKPVIKAKCFEYVCRNIQIDVSVHDHFPAFACYNRLKRPLSPLVGKWHGELFAKIPEGMAVDYRKRNEAGLQMAWMDFDHSAPDWDAMLKLGFPGLRDRAAEYRAMHEKNGTLTEQAAAFFDGIGITVNAVLDCIRRFIDFAKTHNPEHPRIKAEIDCLEQLCKGVPRNTYEVLMFIYLHFMFGEHIDHMQVRTLGNLDDMVYPYYRQDLESGRYTDAEIREFFACFFMQWGSINNYWGQPVYLGGTKADGSTKYNDLSWLILDVMDRLSIPTPKIQLKVGPSTPERLFRMALDMIRRGHSSLVFHGEEPTWRMMMGRGIPEQIAREYQITGCYEVGPKALCNETASGHINLLKPIELVLNDGVDPKTGYVCRASAAPIAEINTFDEFYQAYLRYTENEVDTLIASATELEKHMHDVNPANMFSLTIRHSLEVAKDAFSNGSVYNGTGMLLVGLGTAIDALMAVKELVFETRTLTLAQLRDILKNNWAGQERLRLRMLHSRRKYGNGLPEVDKYAQALVHYLGSRINGHPNGRGGVFSASGHSAKQYFELGKKTGATPDGRFAGDEMSKNLSPTMGADTEGVTALIRSVTTMDSVDLPGDFPLDVMMHPTSVQGEDGLKVMETLIRKFFAGHGLAIHFNVFDASVLEEAQKNPEKYSGLQIRVCGWNTHFTTMIKKEQDAYIERAKRISE